MFWIVVLLKSVGVRESFFDEWKKVASQNAVGEKLFFHYAIKHCDLGRTSSGNYHPHMHHKGILWFW